MAQGVGPPLLEVKLVCERFYERLNGMEAGKRDETINGVQMHFFLCEKI